MKITGVRAYTTNTRTHIGRVYIYNIYTLVFAVKASLGVQKTHIRWFSFAQHIHIRTIMYHRIPLYTTTKHNEWWNWIERGTEANILNAKFGKPLINRLIIQADRQLKRECVSCNFHLVWLRGLSIRSSPLCENICNIDKTQNFTVMKCCMLLSLSRCFQRFPIYFLLHNKC